MFTSNIIGIFNTTEVKKINIDSHFSESKDAGRYHVPIAPDQPLQGIRLIKPVRKYEKFYKDEEVLGIGRPEIKKKKREKEEPEKVTKKRLLLAFSKDRKNSEHVEVNDRWTQKTIHKRSYKESNI
ncbi:hypothetical protein Btru_072508 [Bulinus truncatus]|nr:hypothetical protein Btru_072508 [Bulinus truncatus]